jgi:hypothetical protein
MSPETLFNEDPLDPEAAKIADRYVELIKQFKSVKERKDIQGRNLLGLMRKTNRQKVRHGGYLITVTHKEESDSLKLIELKAAKPKRTGRKR